MSDTLRIILIVGLFFYFFLVIFLLKKKQLALKYTLLWLFIGIAMGILVLFPRLLELIISMTGIELPINGLFAFAIGFIIILLMALTSIVSKQSEKIKTLTQQISLIEKKLREKEM